MDCTLRGDNIVLRSHANGRVYRWNEPKRLSGETEDSQRFYAKTELLRLAVTTQWVLSAVLHGVVFEFPHAPLAAVTSMLHKEEVSEPTNMNVLILWRMSDIRNSGDESVASFNFTSNQTKQRNETN